MKGNKILQSEYKHGHELTIILILLQMIFWSHCERSLQKIQHQREKQSSRYSHH